MPRPRPGDLLAAPDGPLEARLRLVRSFTSRHRRLGAALCTGAAVLAAVSALTPTSSSQAVGASGDGGLRAASLLPAGAGREAVDRAHRVAVAVRLADPAGTLLLSAGAHVEVVGGLPAGATTGDADAATVLAADAVVLDVPGRSTGGGEDASVAVGGLAAGGQTETSGLDGVVVLSVVPADAHRLAGAAGSRPLSVAVRLPPP